jgi:hypothetical protein
MMLKRANRRLRVLEVDVGRNSCIVLRVKQRPVIN